MAEPTEAELIEGAQEGDRRAFGGLVRMHQRRVYAVALHMLGDVGEAEDAVQEALLRAWRAIGRFDGRSELSTWLYRITVNVCLNAIRRRKRAPSADVDDPRIPEPIADADKAGVDPRRATEQRRLYGRLAVALDALSPTLRATVVLVLIQGVAHKDAAEALGCPEGTIAWRIHEARRRLRDELSELFGDGDGEDEEAAAAVARGTS